MLVRFAVADKFVVVEFRVMSYIVTFMIMIFGKVRTACFSMLHYVHETGSTAFVLKNVDAVERARPKIFRRLA